MDFHRLEAAVKSGKRVLLLKGRLVVTEGAAIAQTEKGKWDLVLNGEVASLPDVNFHEPRHIGTVTEVALPLHHVQIGDRLLRSLHLEQYTGHGSTAIENGKLTELEGSLKTPSSCYKIETGRERGRWKRTSLRIW